MTTVAYKYGQISADSRVIGGNIIVASMTKIAKRDRLLAGACGSAAFAQEFLAWFKAGNGFAPPKRGEYDKGIVISPDGTIEVFEDAGRFKVKPQCFAMGSGKELALGAMFAGATAMQAVEIACRLDPGSGGLVEEFEHGPE
jgi:ATP-dependent protease HslVU (ClpYQ) peptidase subunit